MDAKTKFEQVWGRVRGELVGHIEGVGMPPDAVEWYRNNLDYNVPGGKLNRGISVVDTVQILKGSELSDDEYQKSAVLGWCVELLQGVFLVSDDIMDGSITRRGKPCYYRSPGVGMVSINDSCMLEGAIYRLLKAHFRGTPYYVDLLEIFHETTYKTEMGQLVDLLTAHEDKVNLNHFSLEKHHFIVTYKTAYYSFYLPVALALYMSGVPASYTLAGKTVEPYKIALDILLPLGEYFQIQDDFLDFSATPEQLGKVGTDILTNKCSWCVNTALAFATPEQRAVLDANYGRKGKAEEARVKEVFEAVGLRERFAMYEKEVYGKFVVLIDAIPEAEAGRLGTLRRAIFTSFLEKIYQRRM
ncbi:farnesyl-diphosphate synthase [Mycena rebaudengoi]|nr:farnesyl-diphosphate synthase [Mycena rebaudengoi]